MRVGGPAARAWVQLSPIHRTALSRETFSMQTKLSGMAVAAAAATLFIAGCAAPGGGSGDKIADAGTVKVKCYGVNSCKGQSECKTAMSSCKGHNSCKGQGFMMMGEQACIEQLGRA
jgi:hypothetical protein